MYAKAIIFLVCGAVLALGACTDTKTDPAAVARADAAEDALSDLRASLARAQAALAAASTVEQRTKARETVEAAQKDLKKVQMDLQGQPESPARAAADNALKAVDTALERTAAALRDTASGTGLLSLASMHTSLDRAQSALATAQAEITKALAAAGSDSALGNLLSQAQVTLSTAQISLLPLLRQELADARSERDTAQDDFDMATAEVARLEGALRVARDKVTELEDALDTAEKENTAEVARLKGELSTAQADVRRLTGELATANARVDTLTEERDNLLGGIKLGEMIAPEQLARNITPAFSTGGTANVTWTARTMADSIDANPNKLDIEQDAVPYATGKMLISANAIGTDEFQLRGLTVRGQLNNGPDETGDLEFHGGIEGGSASDLGVTLGDDNWDRTDAKVLSSIQLKEDGSGFTMKMGGDGIIFYDMERLTAIGPNNDYSNQPGNVACAGVDDAKCDDPTTSDITAVFDNPAKDPDGEAAYHFSMVVPTNPETPHTETREDNAGGESLPDWLIFKNSLGQQAYRVSDAAGPYTDGDGKYKVVWAAEADAPDGGVILEYRRANRIANGLPVDQLGVYTVKLSNYAGVDGDDEHRYLKYAAYGLFNFLDYSGSPWFSRMQAFHFGYDAFSDADGNRPMDFSTGVTTATFNGKTTGWVLQNPNGNAGNISQLVRLRGDVSLTATLGGGGSNGTISGSMENFEFLQSGAWSKLPHIIFGHSNAATTDGVTLMSADIGADGSYAGVAKTTDTDNARFGDGRYGGAFYGLQERGELETAGYWMLPRHISGTGVDAGLESCHNARTGPSCITFGSIIGSFGAVSEPPE